MVIAETAVADQGGTIVPAQVRDRLDIEAGDKLRWEITDEHTLTVEVKRQREGTFSDFEPYDSGSPTNGAVIDDLAGAEDDEMLEKYEDDS
jgi:bifunctional DNA-binding transcriptional regulator/antitoxin component of YhaV-PrlF toxin-antitoxin module